jgi:hypothetical protein
VALAMQEIIDTEAVDGWEYLRTDLVPVEEKASFFSRTQEVQRAVLIFRRDALVERPVLAAGDARAIAGMAQNEVSLPDDRADAREVREGRMALSAERGAPPQRTNRPPTGLR